MFLWRSTIEVKMFCPTRCVVDATKSSKDGGVAAEGCSSQTGLWFCTLLRDIRTYYVHDQIYSAKRIKETRPWGQVSGWRYRICVQKFRVHLLKTTWTLELLCGKHVTLFYYCSWGSVWYEIPGSIWHSNRWCKQYSWGRKLPPFTLNQLVSTKRPKHEK